MEGDGERGHRCRVCRKSFSTGRSLGGHMRSHVVMNSMEVVVEEKKIRSSVGVVNGYGLRENPRKTKRFTISLKKRFEKECGESLKSLFGDIRYVDDDADDDDDDDHIQEDGEEDEQEEEEEEGSWSVLSDNEVTGLVIPSKKRRSRRMSMAMEAQASSSSALEQEEQEDVALALMMLSRDTGHWNVHAESSDKNSVVDEEQQQQQQQQLLVSDNGFGFKKQKMIVSDDNDSFEQCDSRKRSKYECSTCKKSFQSYQALGGHRAAHKRHPGGCLGLRIDENGIENTNSDAAMDVLDTKKAKSHACLICGKCFSSGQALGGHKRSHLASTSIDGGSDQNAVIPDLIESSIDGGGDQNAVIPDLIDLNLPAPVDDESKFKNWWNCDAAAAAAVGMISN